MKANKLKAKRSLLLFSVPLLIALFFLVNTGGRTKNVPALPRPIADKIKVVVIDPGHGGHDTGCLGASSREKDVALAVSLKLGKYIEDNFPDVKVVYTRKTDVFVELYRRAQIANENKADLFICVHCNSGPKAAYGVETYVMGLHKSEGNLSVAKRENSAILMEQDYSKQYEGYDPNSPEADIIFSLYQSAYLDRSLQFASKVQDQVRLFAKRYDRKVRQAGFLVLWKTSMPSVLIETGFLTNDAEHDFLSSKKGQTLIAASIYRAFVAYKSEVDGEKYEDKLKTDTIAGYKPKVEAPVVKPIVEDAEDKDTATVKLVIPPPDKSKTEPDKPKVEPDKPKTNDAGLVYRVQFYSSPTKVGLSATKFADLTDVYEYKSDANYRYTAGKYSKFADAVKYQATVRSKGFKDAFVVVFKDGKRLTGEDAKKYLR